MSTSADQPPRQERPGSDVIAPGAKRRLYAIDGGARGTWTRSGVTGRPAKRRPSAIDLQRLQRAIAGAGGPVEPAVPSRDGRADVVALHRPRIIRAPAPAPGPGPIDRGAA